MKITGISKNRLKTSHDLAFEHIYSVSAMVIKGDNYNNIQSYYVCNHTFRHKINTS